MYIKKLRSREARIRNNELSNRRRTQGTINPIGTTHASWITDSSGITRNRNKLNLAILAEEISQNLK